MSVKVYVREKLAGAMRGLKLFLERATNCLHCLRVKNKLLKILSKERSDILDKSGGVLYSSYRTVRRGDFFIMGLNPGGNPEDMKEHTIKYDIELKYKKCCENKWWNEYFDERWNNKEAGKSKLQLNMRYFIQKLLGDENDLRKICASNLCFIRTRNEKELKKDLIDKCWPVNEWLLKTIKPKVIITFSNVSYEYLKEKFENADLEEEIDAKWGNWKIRLCKIPNKKNKNKITGRETVLLYIPHLSRYTFQGRESVIEEIKEKLGLDK